MIKNEIHKGLPFEHEAFLIKRYNSYLTTCRYLEIFHPYCDFYHIAFTQEGELKELIVFGNSGNTAFCFNSLASMEESLIAEFSELIFNKFPKISKVKIDAAYRTYELAKSVMVYKSDNQILELPKTVDEYQTNLGAKKRKNIKNRITKLLNDFHSVNFTIRCGKEINESVVDTIVQFNRSRMKTKGKISGINNELENNIFKYACFYGCVGVLELDGKIIGGAIGTVINNDIFMHVISYDESFLEYNIGEICAFYMIQHAIEKGWLRFHFLWGKNELKRRMMAENHDLYSYYIFKNYSFNYYMVRIKVAINERLILLKDLSIFQPIKKVLMTIRLAKG